MKLHRFYLPDTDLVHDFWMQDAHLFHQWTRVLRFEVGREVELFNDKQEDRLYRIVKIGDNAVHLELITEMQPKLPKKDIYLCFSLLKKDKNDWVLQKATELGVRHFVPLLCDRTEKMGFDIERAQKIVIEASEQCGRTDIPRIREPLTVERAIEELVSDGVELLVAEQSAPDETRNMKHEKGKNSVGILIGPEGGWSDKEKEFFTQQELKHLALSDFTLRAETACVTAAALLQ